MPNLVKIALSGTLLYECEMLLFLHFIICPFFILAASINALTDFNGRWIKCVDSCKVGPFVCLHPVANIG